MSLNNFPVLTGFLLLTKVEGLVHCGFAQVLIKKMDQDRSKDGSNQSVLRHSLCTSHHACLEKESVSNSFPSHL